MIKMAELCVREAVLIIDGVWMLHNSVLDAGIQQADVKFKPGNQRHRE